jgi:hypothetical protein
MKRLVPFLIGLGGLFAGAWGRPQVSMHTQHAPGKSKPSYDFIAWANGESDSIRFESVLEKNFEGYSFVVVRDKFLARKNPRRLLPFEVDSLKGLRVKSNWQKALVDSLRYGPDSVWVKARRHGKLWVFPHFPGRAGLYGEEPVGEFAYMDTGSGLVPYSKEAYRSFLNRDSAAAAEVLRGSSLVPGRIYPRAIEAYDRGYPR